MLAVPTEDEINALLADVSFNIELQGLIGKGGQKHVFKAYDVGTRQPYVFKVIQPSVTDVDRIKREVHAVDVIGHGNIPRVIETNADIITDDSQLVWIVEEFIEGSSLRDILASGQTYNLQDIVSFLDTMFSVLEVSESHNIVHRDIKPENIMVDNTGKYWLIDFGISRHLDLASLTLTHAPFGLFTIGYSASEQLRNRKKEIDIRADLFSLGVVVTEMISGQNPFLHEATDILQVVKRIDEQPLPLLRISGDDRFLMARFIKLIGDIRLSRRPRSVREAKAIFEVVKPTLSL